MKMDISKYVVSIDLTIMQTMQRIDEGAKGIVFVVDHEQKLIGCITDGDIRRWLIKTADFSATSSKVMSCNPKFVTASDVNHAHCVMRTHSINAVPVLNHEHRIIDIIFMNDTIVSESAAANSTLRGVPIVIMAGGKGTRLYPYTLVMPKPLIPIGDITIIERIINQFMSYGADLFYLSVNYKKSMIKAYFEELALPCTIRYIEEDRPLGTAGSLRLISDEVKQTMFVTNCDILIDADLSAIYTAHKSSDSPMTIVSALKDFTIPYGVLKTNADGLLEAMMEKPIVSHYINTGMYLIEPSLLGTIPNDTFFHMTDLANQCLQNKLNVGVYAVDEDSFLDMGEFQEMKRMEEKLQKG